MDQSVDFDAGLPLPPTVVGARYISKNKRVVPREDFYAVD